MFGGLLSGISGVFGLEGPNLQHITGFVQITGEVRSKTTCAESGAGFDALGGGGGGSIGRSKKGAGRCSRKNP